MKIVVEYLVVIDKSSPDSNALYTFCQDEKAFLKLLSADSQLFFNKNKITFESCEIAFLKIITSIVKDKTQRYFHLIFEFTEDQNKLEVFNKMLHTARAIISKAGGQIETLWDDVSLLYSQIGYSKISRIENLMRKLITYFMITNIGKDWVDEAAPLNFKEALNKSKRSQYIDKLHQVDFIQLGDLLFSTYQRKNLNDLFDKINKAENNGQLDLEELKSFVIKSNWDRFFSKIVDCDDIYLKKSWEELYELRCKIAHNSIINKNDLERIDTLVKNVEDKLQTAINNVQRIEIPQEEKEKIAENVASSISKYIGEYIRFWNIFEHYINIYANITDPKTPITWKIRKLVADDYITEDESREYYELVNFRNYIVHNNAMEIEPGIIKTYMEKLINKISQLKIGWKDELITTLISLGGRGSLSDIYEHIEKNTRRKLSSNWRAVARRTLQLYSSDTETYKGGEDIFKHVKSGEWELRK